MKLSKQCQRVLSLLLAILFLATSMPSSVYASEISVSPEAAYTENVDEVDTQENEVAEVQQEEEIQEDKSEDLKSSTEEVSEDLENEINNVSENSSIAEESSVVSAEDSSVVDTYTGEESTPVDDVDKVNIVTDMKIIAGTYSKDDASKYIDALDGRFEIGKTEYDDVVLTSESRSVCLKLSDEIQQKGTLYFEFWYNGVQDTGRFGTRTLSVDATTGVARKSLTSAKLNAKETTKVEIKVGTKQGDTWDMMECYTLNVRYFPSLNLLSVKANGASVELTPGKTTGVYTFENVFKGVASKKVASIEMTLSMDKTYACYLGTDKITNAMGRAQISIQLKDYIEDGDKAIIPLTLKRIGGDGKEVIRNLSIELDLLDIPEITKQPQNITCAKNEKVELTVEADEPANGQLSYQWYETESSGDHTVEGATASRFVPTTENIGDKKYYCLITNTVEGKTYSKKSEVVTVSVCEWDIEPPRIVEQPEDVSCALNAKTSIYATVQEPEAGDITYVWYGTGGSSVDSGSHVYFPDTSEAGTKEYYCKIIWKYNGVNYNFYTEAATVTVDKTWTGVDYLPVISKEPTSVKCNKGDTAELSVEVETPKEGSITYQWYRNNGRKVEGATGAIFTTIPNKEGAIYYYCEITNTINGKKYINQSEVASINAKLTYITQPTIVKDFGSYYKENKDDNNKLTEYPQEYQVGEIPKPIYFRYALYDSSVNCTYEIYHSTESTFNEQAELVNEATVSGTYAFDEKEYTVKEGYAELKNGYEEGTHYFFCKVIVSAQNNDAIEPVSLIMGPVAITFANNSQEFEGSGSVDDPYKINTAENLVKLQKLVNSGTAFAGLYFKLTADITLPVDWTPIGCTKDGSTNIQNGANLNAFSGTIDGDGKTLTVPTGGFPLLGYVKDTTVKNLNIYGEQINGAGLVNNYTGVGLSGNAITLENVCLKSGTKTLKSGLIASSAGSIFACASAGFVITIRDCVIEDDVIVGYNADQSMIGSFADRINGTVENSTSSATVKGKDYVGGIIAGKDNAMGQCSVKNTTFHGTIEASGSYVGGIVGGGYDNSTAPNGACPTIMSCAVDGTVKGDERVGGIFGGDGYVAQTWSNVVGAISANTFTGKVSGNKYVGGIIGYRNSLNRYDNAHVR